MINSRNDDILARGRNEMEGIPGGWPSHHDEPTNYVDGQPPNPPTYSSGGMKKLFKRKPVATQGTEI